MNKRLLIVSSLLALVIVLSFVLPRHKYTSSGEFALTMPTMPGWAFQNISNSVDLQDERFNFVSKLDAYEFRSRLGEQLTFLLLDAGNFHNPQTCFLASGRTVEDLPDIPFRLKDHPFNARAMFAGKDGEGFLIIYWITIDKKIVNWTEQKVKQFFFSLFAQKTTSLMMRVDIPMSRKNLNPSISLAREFLEALDTSLPQEKADYILGKVS